MIPPSAKHAAWLVALHEPVFEGSRIYGYGWPRLFVLSEKSPCRSFSVGSRYRVTSPPTVRGWNSCVKKKNSLFWRPGLPIGPPIENPQSRSSWNGFGSPLRMLVLLLAFQREFRSTS